MAIRLDTQSPDFSQTFDALLSSKRELSVDVSAIVSAIIEQVRAEGDKAVLALTRQFDWPIESMAQARVSAEEIKAASQALAPDTIAAFEHAARRIADYHRRQLPEDVRWVDDDGVELGWRWGPLDSVGLYVPGGTASLSSSVLMNAIPAKVAGVGRLVVTTPTPGGVVNPLVLAAAHLAGVDEVWRVGGAQAVAALAYGTGRIAPVDVITGPGNAWVAEAKRQLFGVVGIDLIAGPSEVCVVADASVEPAWIATDLLAQAEHDAAAQSVLLTDDPNFADAVAKAVDIFEPVRPRAILGLPDSVRLPCRV